MVLFAKVVHSTLALLPFFVFIEKRLGQHCTTIYKGNGFVIDFYSNALDGEGELYWNVYSCQENNGDLTLTLKKSFLYSKNNYSASIKTPDEKYIGEKYIYKSLSCGENSYAGIHISNKGKNMQKFGLKLKKIKGSCEIYTYVRGTIHFVCK